MFLFDDDAIYAEALRRIKECADKGKRKLDLSDLSLKVIPQEIAGLKSLTELDITGSALKEIPDSIGNLRSLRRLSLGFHESDLPQKERSFINISPPLPPASGNSPDIDDENRGIVLPESLAHLTNLQNISLGYGFSALPEWLWDMHNLRALSIRSDWITAAPTGIGRLKNLRKLRIYGENISALPDEIGLLPLSVLDLKCPRLAALPESFSNLKKMTILFIRDCNFSAIPDFICGWTELEGLRLYMYDTFQGPVTTLTKIPENIGNLKKLQVLDLESTRIEKLPESLCECPLTYLSLSGNLRKLPENFGKLTGLKELDLSAYELRRLPRSFGNLSALEEFTFRGGSLEELPESAGNLSSLKNLTIMTGGELRLPESFGGLSALEELYIDAEHMKALPQSIGKCGALKSFTLNSDAISELPPSFVKLANLETFWADTFNLKSLPADFGDLAALKNLDIFSGALTAFPESMGTLRNLKSLRLDAQHVLKAPGSFRELSYVKERSIIIGGRGQNIENPSQAKKTGASVVDFDDLMRMSWRYRWKILERCSLKALENLLRHAPHYYSAGVTEKEIVKNILLKRSRLLNRKFEWTRENISRIVQVSDKFLAAWEAGFAKAKSVIDILYENEPDKEAFRDKYGVEIILEPEIRVKNPDNGEFEYPDDTVYSVLMDYLAGGIDLTISINGNDYDPVTHDESGFWENSHVSRRLSWNIEGFGDIDLADQYICYAIHVLYSHHEWANEDILKISDINSRLTITHRSNSGVF
jgi:Leucine-rich repeat (LRR) protein